MSDDLPAHSLSELTLRIARREVSPRQVVASSLECINQLNPTLNAFISVRAEKALDEMRATEEAVRSGLPPGPLYGIPVAVKDNIDVAGEVTTVGSPLFRSEVASTDAEVVRRLRAAGAIIVGKTNLHEFAQGATTINPHFGPARNPWNQALSPGGSSGGSAVAVSAGMVPAALGTDTGGSVRLPAAFCNLTGVRPPAGLIPTQGAFPVSLTLDTIGPLAHSIRDCWLILGALANLPLPTGPLGEPRGVRIGVPQDSYLWSRADPAIVKVFEEWINQICEHGVQKVEVELPGLPDASRAAGIISLMESVEVHRDRLFKPEQFGEDVRRLLTRGLSHTRDDLAAALQIGQAWMLEVKQVFNKVNVIALPTSPVFPPRYRSA